ncbi:hypothetical protein PVAR5_7630 [Paecilomyces variotii No. 5]|uniref:Uncharacterized protein n=1 Tax=Byssochlamys spectabilis (strain No. 5 / NBRC 109023) TaxID=1356009 RepID=V5GDD0_BYSSN|nr:hypothetical protein PVAR5_7630 [Paecilomyces variotii No. 5]
MFSGLRCTKVRRTAVPSEEAATSTSAEATTTNKMTVTSSVRETQVSTASDPVFRPNAGSMTATGTAGTEVTSWVSLLPSSTDTSTTPAGISSKDPTATNSTGQTTLRIALIASIGALVLLILAALVWKLLQRRWKRITRDATGYYATEKPQLDRRISTPNLSPGGSSFQEGKSGSNIHIRDSLAQLEPLPRVVATSPAERPRGALPERSDYKGRLYSADRLDSRNPTDLRDPFSDAAQIRESDGRDDAAAVIKDPFADPSQPTERENRLLQVRRSLSPSDSRLQRATSRSSTGRGRKDGTNQYESHTREESASSSIIVLPGHNSLSPSLSYQPIPASLGQWRPDPEKQSTRSSRVSSRSDPFDLEETSMTRSTIVRPDEADTQFDQTFSGTTDSTIDYSKNDNGK